MKNASIPPTLSKRGISATKVPLRTDMDLFFKAKDNQWHPQQNPTGKFPLNVAENNLCWDLLEQKLGAVLESKKLPKWISGYTDMKGDASFLETMATFMTKHLCHTPINADYLLSAAGAAAIIELASWILCDADDVAVFPAPAYPVYTQDIGSKARVERYNLLTHHNLDELQEGHSLSIRHLEQTWADLQDGGKQFRLLVLTTPDNPTGSIYSHQKLLEISQWCIDNKIHLLVNELYGLSRIDTQHPSIVNDYSKQIEFKSFAQIINQKKSDYLHLAYGLSKDFGISGFRVGLLYTLNEQFHLAFENLTAPHLVSNYTQWMITEVFSDQHFLQKYIATNQKRLTENYITVIKSLKKIEIPYVPAYGSLFVWMDLSTLMSDNTQAEEQKLWRNIYDELGILLTPGIDFGHSKWGQFRLVHPFIQKSALEEVMKRLEVFVLTRR